MLYMERVLEALLQEGGRIDEADLALLSPARSTHLNPYGKFPKVSGLLADGMPTISA